MKLALIVLAFVLATAPAFAAEEDMHAGDSGPQTFVALLELTVNPMEEGGAELLGNHIDYLGELYDAGVLLMAGPFADDEETHQGMLILRAANLEEAMGYIEGDPTNQAGGLIVHSVRAFWDAFNAGEGRRFSREEFDAMMAAQMESAAAAK